MIVVAIENTRRHPIRIREIQVLAPEYYAASAAVGERELLSVSPGDPAPMGGLLNWLVAPRETLNLSMTFVPATEGSPLDLRISWRSEGARSWWCVPITIRRSRSALLEMCGHQLSKPDDNW